MFREFTGEFKVIRINDYHSAQNSKATKPTHTIELCHIIVMTLIILL